MRVLHIGLSCTHGGVESVYATLVRELRKLGVHADVFFERDAGASDQYEGVCRVMFKHTHLLAEVLLKGRYDVVHLNTDVAKWVKRSLVASFYRGAVVITSHQQGYYEKFIENARVVAVSKAVADSIRDKYAREITVVYNGINTDLFYPPSQFTGGKPVLGWVGRSNDPHKDVGGLIAVAHSPVAKGFQIVVVDGAPKGLECENWFPNETIFRRRLPWLEMPDFYRSVAASRGFLLSTSRTEGCPMNMLEAQACGCPVIAPRVGGVPETVKHKETGYLYDPKLGTEAVAEAIDWLYSADNHERASKAAVEHVRSRFSSERMCREYLAIYEEELKHVRTSFGALVARQGVRLAMPAVKLVSGLYRRRVG